MSYKIRIVTQDEETCFSKHPLPTCGEDYDIKATVKKSEAFHCTAVKSIADHFTKMVNKGVRPDYSKLQAVKYISLSVPVKCAYNPTA
jgi:hypothetical protein